MPQVLRNRAGGPASYSQGANNPLTAESGRDGWPGRQQSPRCGCPIRGSCEWGFLNFFGLNPRTLQPPKHLPGRWPSHSIRQDLLGGSVPHSLWVRGAAHRGERDKLRSRVSNAARCGESCSVTAVNFKPSPLPGTMCRTMASTRIWPSWTRKSSRALVPTGSGLVAAINRPPALRSRTRETSSIPLQRQYTHTPSGDSTREVWRRE